MPFFQEETRSYAHCRQCDLVFVLRQYLPSPQEEKARYDTHQNEVNDSRYRDFLSRLHKPLVEKLSVGMKGLDYGCGPGPALAHMFRESGFEMFTYDPIYAKDDQALNRSYDFITCTETAEHFHFPGNELKTLNGLLNPRGWLGVMTERLEDWNQFPQWYYKNDPTHVSFYSRTTFEWVARYFGWTPHFIERSVVLFENEVL